MPWSGEKAFPFCSISVVVRLRVSGGKVALLLGRQATHDEGLLNGRIRHLDHESVGHV
jgi:hypothetical protein